MAPYSAPVDQYIHVPAGPYPADHRVQRYTPTQHFQSPPAPPLPQPQSMRHSAPIQYSQCSCVVPRYPQQSPLPQLPQPSYTTARMSDGYPAYDYEGQSVRPANNLRTTSHRSTHSNRSTREREERDGKHNRKNGHADSRPTLGDSVYWVWDAVKFSLLGRE